MAITQTFGLSHCCTIESKNSFLLNNTSDDSILPDSPNITFVRGCCCHEIVWYKSIFGTDNSTVRQVYLSYTIKVWLYRSHGCMIG